MFLRKLANFIDFRFLCLSSKYEENSHQNLKNVNEDKNGYG